MSAGVASSVDGISAQFEAAPASFTLADRPPRAVGRALHVAPWLADATVLVAASGATALVAGSGIASTTFWSSLFALGVAVCLANRGLYRPWIGPRLLETWRALLASASVTAAILASTRVLVIGDSAVSARETMGCWIVAMAFLCVTTTARRLVVLHRVRAPHGGLPTLIVGAGEVGQAVARRLRAAPQHGLRPVGFLDKEPFAGSPRSEEADELPVLGASWDIDYVVASHGIRHVIVAFSTAPTAVLIRLLERCEQLGVRVSYIPRFFERSSERFAIDRLGGLPLISPWAADPRGFAFRLKYAVDRLLAAAAVILLAPLLTALALAVLATSGRPILYRQERVGRDGRRFAMLKFRSMRTADASQPSSPIELAPDTAPGGVEGDDRRTRLGVFLRQTSLDELPQLFNVVKGEMSFVGPRPERPEFVELFDKSVRRYGQRHRVKSGITGWAQVNGLRGKTSIADRVDCDNYYIENWSFWLDFMILLQTARAVIRPAGVE